MNSSFEEGCSFKYCRICLRSDDDNTFSQLYDKGNEDMAEMFEAISGFDVSISELSIFLSHFLILFFYS